MAKPPKPKQRYAVYAIHQDGTANLLDSTSAVSKKQAENYVRWRKFGKTPVSDLEFKLVAKLELPNQIRRQDRQMSLFSGDRNAMML